MLSEITTNSALRVLTAVLLECGNTITVSCNNIDQALNKDWKLSKTNNPDGTYTFEIVEDTTHPDQMALHLPNANTGD